MPTNVATLPTMHSPLDLHRFDPGRAPDWRDHRVRALIEHRPRPLHCTEFDDEFTREMWQFMFGHRAGDADERQRLAERFPGQALAFEIHERTDPELRLQL